MIQKLPIHEFTWEKVDNFTPEKIDRLVKTDKKGNILEVDVDYAKELHKNHNEPQLSLKRMKIRKMK